MSPQVLFNQFAYSERLKRGGFSEEQARASAEALGEAFSETVATKADLEKTETALRSDVQRLEAKVEDESRRLDAKIDLFKAELRAGIAKGNKEVIRWVLAINAASAGLLFTAMKLFK